jgi:hypothetical protein
MMSKPKKSEEEDFTLRIYQINVAVMLHTVHLECTLFDFRPGYQLPELSFP